MKVFVLVVLCVLLVGSALASQRCARICSANPFIMKNQQQLKACMTRCAKGNRSINQYNSFEREVTPLSFTEDVAQNTKLCLKSGLNVRSQPCGAVFTTTSSAITVTSLNQRKVVPNCQSGSKLEWLFVQLPNGQQGWIANLPNMVSVCSSPPTPSSNGISLEQLRRIMPLLSTSKGQEYLPHLNDAMSWGNINTCARRAAFLAQLAHESGQFRYMEEIASGAAYEGRKDLGNIYPGDGVRYKGRGPIQVTGRANYRTAGKALGVDLESNPTLASTPKWGFKIAAWYWTSRSLNNLADQHSQSAFDQITRKINGGYNGKADRDQYWVKAKSVLGC